MMEGVAEFSPYCSLLLAADTALDAAKQTLPGRNYHDIKAVVFSAFAVEASNNHIGIDSDPNWTADDRKMGGWEKKLEAVAAKFLMPLDFSTGHAKTVKEAFQVRDKRAHGRTWVGKQRDLDDGTGICSANVPL
jgi:hypothetical protein